MPPAKGGAGRGRILALAAGAALLVAFAGYALYWRVAADRLAEAAAGWVAGLRADGFEVVAAEPAVGGFPLALTIRFAGPSVAAPNGAWRWRGPDILGRARPWRPGAMAWTLAGRHELELAKPGGSYRVALEAGSATLEVALPPAPPADHRDSGLDFALRMAGVELSEGVPAALRQPIALAELSGAIMGRPPAVRRLDLATWRDAGGTLEIRRLVLDWGPLDLAAEGTVALDRDLQPEAALSAAFSGHNEAIDRLVEAGIVTPRRALIAKLALSALAHPAPDGGPRVTVPVTLQDGFLYLGPAKLIPVPPIDWR